MRIASTLALSLILTVGIDLPLHVFRTAITQSDEYLTWSAKQAQTIGKGMRESGRVGGIMGYRGLHTERAGNYKLRATWLTPEVIRASARIEQIRSRLSDDKTRELVAQAEAVGDTVVMVEVDPREGSGVIPLDWQAFLQPKGLKPDNANAVAGINSPKLRDMKALAGVAERDYDYDILWVVFPLIDEKGRPLFPDSVREVELVVRIYNKEGKVSWPIPDSIRNQIKNLKR
jgi:hypothetical protein